MGSYRRYTEEQKAAAVQMVRDGKTVRAAAGRFQASERSVKRWCVAAGVTPRLGQRGVPQQVRTEAALLVRSGSSFTAVAARYGVSRTAVHNWVEEFNAARNGLADLTAEEMVGMVAHGVAIAKVAKRAGLTVEAVEKALRRAGVSR